jgi:hypothetical protein
MRAQEFIIEKKDGKLTKRQQQSTRGVNTYGDSEHVSGDYTSYRLGMAVAGADGHTPLANIDAKSWIQKQKTTHPYTQEEQDMLRQAYDAVGAVWHDLNHGDMKSKELDSTYTVSPVPDRNKLTK